VRCFSLGCDILCVIAWCARYLVLCRLVDRVLFLFES